MIWAATNKTAWLVARNHSVSLNLISSLAQISKKQTQTFPPVLAHADAQPLESAPLENSYLFNNMAKPKKSLLIRIEVKDGQVISESFTDSWRATRPIFFLSYKEKKSNSICDWPVTSVCDPKNVSTNLPLNHIPNDVSVQVFFHDCLTCFCLLLIVTVNQ